MTRAAATAVLDTDGVAASTRPWDAVVRERTVLAGPERWSFVADTGPVRTWQREVVLGPPGPDGTRAVRQTVDYRLALPLFSWLFALPVRHELRRLPLLTRTPWWAPPAVMDEVAASSLCALCVAALACGYLGTLVTQTLSFAGTEFGVGSRGQGVALAVARIDIVVTVLTVALADRRGRRPVLAGAIVAAILLTAVAAFSPSLTVLVALQIPARGLTAAAIILVTIMAAEEMPAGSRAYAVSVLTLIGAFGAGNCVLTLPLADLGVRAWRISFVIPLVYLLLLRPAFRFLPESRRFVRRHAAVGLRGHGPRLFLMSMAGFLTSLFLTPAAQLQNTFLRDERGFSGLRITVFILVTSTPAGIGVGLGGRLADTRGRRQMFAIGLVGGAAGTALEFVTHGWALWWWSLAGTVVGALGIAAFGAYGPELFPTALRGRANGFIAAAGRAGSVVGLLAASLLSDRLGSLGNAIALLAVGPILLAGVILLAYPETAARELEDINPEDASPAP